jgi:hypothetical protein
MQNLKGTKMVEVTENNSGDAPNASSSQPAAVPGNPGVEAEGGRAFAHGNRPDPMDPNVPEDRLVKAGDVDTKEETKDMAGVRVDPITGISVEQIEAAQSDYDGSKAPTGGVRSIPIQAFDSRKLKGHEHVTVRGNTVLVTDPDYDPVASEDQKHKGDESHLPKSVQDERQAGRDAVAGHKKSSEAEGE